MTHFVIGLNGFCGKRVSGYSHSSLGSEVKQSEQALRPAETPIDLACSLGKAAELQRGLGEERRDFYSWSNTITLC